MLLGSCTNRSMLMGACSVHHFWIRFEPQNPIRVRVRLNLGHRCHLFRGAGEQAEHSTPALLLTTLDFILQERGQAYYSWLVLLPSLACRVLSHKLTHERVLPQATHMIAQNGNIHTGPNTHPHPSPASTHPHPCPASTQHFLRAPVAA